MSANEAFDGAARIVDRSYRPYEGRRGGLGSSMATVVKHSVQRSLGIKRTIWQKVLPVVTLAIAFIPAIVFVGMSTFIPDEVRLDDLLPSYHEYYGYITAALVIFTSFVAPEVLCTDRRTGMLGLYLASPLDRNTYLLSKAGAVGGVLAIVTTGPLLLMLAAYTIIGDGPGNVGDFLLLLGRILVSGFAFSALYTGLSLAVSSFTSRRAAASATIILFLMTSAIFVGALTDTEAGAGWSPNLLVFDLITLPLALVHHVFGAAGDLEQPFDDVSFSVVLLGTIGWIVLFAAITRYRYEKLSVSR
jgi:ABC-2 type transport system permease protein